MRRRERVHNYAYRRIIVIFLFVLFFYVMSSSLAISAVASPPIAFDRYDNLVSGAGTDTESEPTGAASSTGQTPAQIAESKDEIDMRQFNGRTLDTVIFILGGLAGFMMVLQLTMFCVTRIFPSTNKWVEKLSVVGIDGYDRGFIVPTIKILLLGVLSFLCISGTMKQIVGFILGLFAVKFL